MAPIMSLKGFHIVFISFSITLSILFGWWAINNYLQNSNSSFLVTSICAFIVALGLGIYEYFFIKKIQTDND